MAKSKSKEEKTNRWIKVSYFQLALGIILNILTIAVFILLYHAYILKPRLEANSFQAKGLNGGTENGMPSVTMPARNN
jgi:hypothetical protein